MEHLEAFGTSSKNSYTALYAKVFLVFQAPLFSPFSEFLRDWVACLVRAQKIMYLLCILKFSRP